MNRYKNLDTALRFTQITLGLVLILFFGFLFLSISSFKENSISNSLIVSDASTPKFGVVSLKWCPDCAEKVGNRLMDYEPAMRVWMIVRGSLFFIITGLIFLQIIRILKSVRSKNTFYEGNIEGLNRLAVYGILIAVFSSFNFFISEEKFNVYTSIPFGPIGFAIACKVLSDIFKEGKNLTEDNQSII